MFLFIIISLVLFGGFARLLVFLNNADIIKNWKENRCKLHVMVFASLFKEKNDPRSSSEFASNNFSFCSSEIAKDVLKVALKPIQSIFSTMMNACVQSMGLTLNLRTLAAHLFAGINRIIDIFVRRFNLIIHEIAKNFRLQLNAFSKAHAIANAAVYTGISMVKALQNFWEFIIIVCISILVILIVMMIFLWFVLAPVIPMILSAVAVIGVTASAGAVGGMASAFCFHPDTPVIMKDETIKLMRDIRIGDELIDNSKVTAVMEFNTPCHLYNIDGVLVSGSHIFYNNGLPIFVKDAGFQQTKEIYSQVYCLNTTSHKIHTLGNKGPLVFADWEELDDEDMVSWDKYVQETLNASYNVDNSEYIFNESGFYGSTPLVTKRGNITIDNIRPGDNIKDKDGWTSVKGIVKLESSEGQGSFNDIHGSGANWMLSISGKWIRAYESVDWKCSPAQNLYNIFTDSGSFMVGSTIFRDFSDIGLDKIDDTYDNTINTLTKKTPTKLHITKSTV